MKRTILLLAAICFYLNFSLSSEAQEKKKGPRTKRKVSQSQIQREAKQPAQTQGEQAKALEKPVAPPNALSRLSGEWEMQMEYVQGSAGRSSSSFGFSVSTANLTGKQKLRSEQDAITFYPAPNHSVTLRYDPTSKTYFVSVKADDYMNAARLPNEFPLVYSEEQGFTPQTIEAANTNSKFSPKITFTESGGHIWKLALGYTITFSR